MYINMQITSGNQKRTNKSAKTGEVCKASSKVMDQKKRITINKYHVSNSIKEQQYS